MTLAIAWIRTVGANTELVFASDSRLTGGRNIDHCQKVFSLPREDCCIAFSGSTSIAYPFVLQLQNTIADYKRVFDRAVDITRMRGRVVALLNRFIGNHEDTVPEDFERELAETGFLFGGWSWKYSKFYIWRINYDRGVNRFVGASTGVWDRYDMLRAHAVDLAVTGDYRGDFLSRVEELIGKKLHAAREAGKEVELDYEPLQALAGMLVDPKFVDRRAPLKGLIGGGPQVAKVYPYLRTMHYAVEWQVGPKTVYVLKGRVVADFEIITTLGINPFTGELRRPETGPEQPSNETKSGF
jgi:hypothetical protein